MASTLIQQTVRYYGVISGVDREDRNADVVANIITGGLLFVVDEITIPADLDRESFVELVSRLGLKAVGWVRCAYRC